MLGHDLLEFEISISIKSTKTLLSHLDNKNKSYFILMDFKAKMLLTNWSIFCRLFVFVQFFFRWFFIENNDQPVVAERVDEEGFGIQMDLVRFCHLKVGPTSEVCVLKISFWLKKLRVGGGGSFSFSVFNQSQGPTKNIKKYILKGKISSAIVCVLKIPYFNIIT